MAIRRLRADKLFDGYRFLENRVLIITDEGVVQDVVPRAAASGDLETFDGVLAPGFINCHCHLELSHMKGLIPERTGLVDFVFKVVSTRAAQEDEILTAIDRAEREMAADGIVAVGDICNTAFTLTQKQKANLAYYNFIEATGWLPAVAEERFERAKAIYGLFQTIQPSSIVPHAPYSVSAGLWRRIRPYYQNKVVSIHNQETAFEDEFFLHGTGDFSRMYELMKLDNSHHRPTGLSSLPSYAHKLEDAETVIFVHNTFTKQADIDYLKNSKFKTQNSKFPAVFFCLCVNANQYIENALPPIDLLRSNDCHLVLGTDSLASNWSLSIAAEMKTIQKHFPHISLEELLRWATSNGAKALGMDDKIGSFERGKKPGVVLIDEQTLQVKSRLF